MTIQVFHGATAEAQASAVPDPKVIWNDLGRWVVYTGTDIPVTINSIRPQDIFNAMSNAELDLFNSLCYNVTATPATNPTDAQVQRGRRILLNLLADDGTYLVTDPKMQGWKTFLVAQNVLTQNRADKIFS
jgi:hypothetical protein